MPKDEIDFDLGDMDSIDFDKEFNFGFETQAEPPKNTREAVTRSLKSAGKEFTNRFTNEKLKVAGELADASLPGYMRHEIKDLRDLVIDSKDLITSKTDDFKKATANTLKSITKMVGTENKLGKKLSSIIEKLSTESEYRYQHLTKEQEQQRELQEGILSALGELKDTNAQQLAIQQTIDSKRNATTNNILQSIYAETNLTRTFHYEITNKYYRKSLELQYKHLFTSKEQLELMKSGFDTFKNQLEAVVKNTSLPDIIKVRSTEALKADFLAKMRSDTVNSLYKRFNIFNTVKQNAEKKLTSFLNSVMSGITGVGDMVGLVADQQEMMKSMAMDTGTVVGGHAADLVTGLVGDKIRSKISDTKLAKKLGYHVLSLHGDPRNYLRDLQRKQNKDSIFGRGASSVLGLLNSLTTTASEESVKYGRHDLDEAKTFDGRAYTSITKIIPGILTKIYGEIRATRLGGDGSDHEVVFDYKTDSFNTRANIKTDINQTLTNNLSGVGNGVRQVTKILDDAGIKLSKEQEGILGQALLAYGLRSNTTLSHITLQQPEFLSTIVDKGLATKLTNSGKKLKDYLMSNPDAVSSLSSAMAGIKYAIPSLQNRFSTLYQGGNNDILLDLGVAKYDSNGNMVTNRNGFDKLIMDAYKRTLNPDGSSNSSGGNNNNKLPPDMGMFGMPYMPIGPAPSPKTPSGYTPTGNFFHMPTSIYPNMGNMGTGTTSVNPISLTLTPTGPNTGGAAKSGVLDSNAVNNLKLKVEAIRVKAKVTEELGIQPGEQLPPEVESIITDATTQVPKDVLKKQPEKIQDYLEKKVNTASKEFKTVDNIPTETVEKTLNTSKEELIKNYGTTNPKEIYKQLTGKIATNSKEALSYLKGKGKAFFTKVNEAKNSPSVQHAKESIASGIAAGKNKVMDAINDINNDPTAVFRHGKKAYDAITGAGARSMEDLKAEYFSSEEFKNGTAPNFLTWVNTMGYKIKGQVGLKAILKKTREWDKKIAKFLLSSPFKLVGKIFGRNKSGKKSLISRGLKKVLWDMPNSVQNIALDMLPFGIGTVVKAPFTLMAKVADFIGTAVGLKEKKDDKERKGSWLSRLNIFNKPKERFKLFKNPGKAAKVLGTAGLIAGAAYLLSKMDINLQSVAEWGKKIFEGLSSVFKAIWGIGEKLGGALGWTMDKIGGIFGLGGDGEGGVGSTAAKVGGAVAVAGAVGATVYAAKHPIKTATGIVKATTAVGTKVIPWAVQLVKGIIKFLLDPPGQNTVRSSTMSKVTGWISDNTIGKVKQGIGWIFSKNESKIVKVVEKVVPSPEKMTSLFKKAEKTLASPKIAAKVAKKVPGGIIKGVAKKLGGYIATMLGGPAAILSAGMLLWDLGWILYYMWKDNMSFINALVKQLFDIDLSEKDVQDAVEEIHQKEEQAALEGAKADLSNYTWQQKGAAAVTKAANTITSSNSTIGEKVSAVGSIVKEKAVSVYEKGKGYLTSKPLTDKDNKYPKFSPSPYIIPEKQNNTHPDKLPADVMGLKPDVRERLVGFAKHYYDITGKPLPVGSALRGMDQQIAMWEKDAKVKYTGNREKDRAAMRAAGGKDSSNGGVAGYPSKNSPHVKGEGIDINISATPYSSEVNTKSRHWLFDDILAKYGLKRPFTDFNNKQGKLRERWHITTTGAPYPAIQETDVASIMEEGTSTDKRDVTKLEADVSTTGGKLATNSGYIKDEAISNVISNNNVSSSSGITVPSVSTTTTAPVVQASYTPDPTVSSISGNTNFSTDSMEDILAKQLEVQLKSLTILEDIKAIFSGSRSSSGDIMPTPVVNIKRTEVFNTNIT